MTCTVSLPMMFPFKSPELELSAAVNVTVGVRAGLAVLLGATLLAAAAASGWSLVIMTLSLFLAVGWVVSQFIEPRLYGHTTRLSSLFGVISAMFWTWVFGPVGLFVSTDDIIAGARIFMTRKSLEAYCDAVILPALAVVRLFR